jgi:predicted sugar kinase
MPRARLTFRQRDLAAALKAAKAAGISVARIEVGPNGIVIIPGTPEQAENSAVQPLDYAKALDHAKATGRF